MIDLNLYEIVEDLDLSSGDSLQSFLFSYSKTIDFDALKINHLIFGYFININKNFPGLKYEDLCSLDSYAELIDFIDDFQDLDSEAILSFLDSINNYSKLQSNLKLYFEFLETRLAIIEFDYLMTNLLEPSRNNSSQLYILLQILQSSYRDFLVCVDGKKNFNPKLLDVLICLENHVHFDDLYIQFRAISKNYTYQIIEKIGLLQNNGNSKFIYRLMNDLFSLILEEKAYLQAKKAINIFASNNLAYLVDLFYDLYLEIGSKIVPNLVDFGLATNKAIITSSIFHKSELFSLEIALFSSLKGRIECDLWLNHRSKRKNIYLLLKTLENYFFDNIDNEPEFPQQFVNNNDLKIENLYKILQTCKKHAQTVSNNKKLIEEIVILTRKFRSLFPEIDLYGGLTSQEYSSYVMQNLFDENMETKNLLNILQLFSKSKKSEVKEAFNEICKNTLNQFRDIAKIHVKNRRKVKELIAVLLKNNIFSKQNLDQVLVITLDHLKNSPIDNISDYLIELVKETIEILIDSKEFVCSLYSIDYLKKFHINFLEDIRKNYIKDNESYRIPQEYFLFLRIKLAENRISNQMEFTNETVFKAPSSSFSNKDMKNEICSPPENDRTISRAKISNSKNQESSFNFANLMNITSPVGPNTGGSLPTQSNISKSTSVPTEAHRNKGNEATTVNLDSLIKGYDKDLKDLSNEATQKIIFPLNNCSKSNIDEKAAEIRIALKEENVILWFAKYLVYQRAPVEPNLHGMYIDLVDKIKNKIIFKLMIIDTCKLCNLILGSENVENFNKTTLKNLGTWLGLLTLARNRPIIAKHFNVRETIISAYDKKQIELIIPFICKILMCGRDSVFKPNNAWMSAMLSLLAEIMEFPDNKVALNCEIELVFKTFNIRKEDIPVGRVFREREKKKGYTSETKNIARGLSDGRLTINELPQYINYDQAILTKLNLNPQDFRNVIAQALDRAIHDIINLVISRSVTIALITTKELVLKDFALEPDEMKLLKGANLIIQNLAGNLALITTREPLKSSFIQNLKSILENSGLDETEKDNLVQAVGMDVIDLGCALIKKTVINRAIDDVNNDPMIIDAVEKRRAFKEKNKTYYDETFFKSTQVLPEQLRPTLGGLTRDQFKIYEEFGKNLKTNGMNLRTDRVLDSASLEVIAKFEQYVIQLDRELEGLSDAPSNQDKIRDLQSMHKRAMDLISHSNKFELIILDCAFKIVDPLFSDKISLKKINFFVAVLQELRRFDENLVSDILDWIVSDEKRILKTELLHKLIKDKFLPHQQLDLKFSEAIKNCRLNPLVYQSVVRIVRLCVFEDKILPIQSFANTTENILSSYKLIKDAKTLKFLDEFKQIISQVSSHSALKTPNIVPHQTYVTFLKKAFILFKDPSEVYDEAYNILIEWFNIELEEELPTFISNIITKIFNSDNTMIRFFTYLTDICVAHCSESALVSEANPHRALDYTYIDAMTRLLILLLSGVKEPESIIEIFEKMTQSIIIVLTKNHQVERENFNGRPFYRIFYNIICDLMRKEYKFNPKEIDKIFLILIKFFEELQPLKYPGFSFCWLELISNRYFMPYILSNPNKEFWQHYGTLMIAMFRYFREVVEQDYQRMDSFKLFYKGCLRVLSVILHDFADFLCEGSFFFVEFLPDGFNQVRNMILSAYPKHLVPGDPSRFSEQNEYKEEFQALPAMLYPFEERINSNKINEDILRYLNSSGEKKELTYRTLCAKLVKTENNTTSINYQAVNGFILYLPIIIYQHVNGEIQSYEAGKHQSYELLQKIISSSHGEMKECILNAIINQIKYPNLVTFYYTSFVMKLFTYSGGDDVQDLTQRILVERVRTDRPHPWGLVYVMQKTSHQNKRPEFQEHLKVVTKSTNRSDGGDI